MNQDSPVIMSWTLGVQLGAATLLALFFLVLLRTQRLEALRVWCAAWIAEALAIGAAFSLIIVEYPVPGQPLSAIGRGLLLIMLSAKLSHAFLALRGALLLSADGEALPTQIGPPIVLGTLCGTLLASAAPDARFTLPILWLVVAFAYLRGAARVLRWPASSEPPLLGWTLAGVGVLFLLHVPPTAPYLWASGPLFQWMDYSSVLDAAADTLLALAILVSLEQSHSERLREANRRLEASREKLRQLVDLDPLTGLRNRRGLRQVLDRLSAAGGTLVFLDVDNFKRINDRYGHVAGDHCLMAVARVLARSFRTRDALFRWGGDEFLVVAPELTPTAAESRLVEVSRALAAAEEGAPCSCSVSVGASEVSPGQDAGLVMREADRAMYERKRAAEIHAS